MRVFLQRFKWLGTGFRYTSKSGAVWFWGFFELCAPETEDLLLSGSAFDWRLNGFQWCGNR